MHRPDGSAHAPRRRRLPAAHSGRGLRPDGPGPARPGVTASAATLCALLLTALAAAALQPEPAPDAAGEAPPGDGGRSFPSQDDLDQLGDAPGVADLLRADPRQRLDHSLVGPFPERAGVVPYAPATAFERVVDEAISARAGLASSSTAHRCAAREVGRFVLAHGHLPESGLTEFIAARCGAVGVGVRPALVAAEVSPEVSESELLGSWRPTLDDILARALGGGAVAAGAWFGREGDQAVGVVVAGARAVEVEPFATAAADGSVRIRGRLLEDSEDLHGLVNQGRFGFARCEDEGGTVLPRFALRCTLAPGDDAALLEISARPSGRILGRTVLRVLIRRPDAEARRYRAATGSGGSVAPGDALPEAFLRAVNAERKRAGLDPLALSLPQSRAAARLAPHLFASSLGLGPEMAGELALLGLAAGWSVGRPIEDFQMAMGLTPGTLDPTLLVEEVLRHPSGREALLAPGAGVLAVGADASTSPPALGAVLASYQLFDAFDPEAATRRLRERLEAARRAKGLDTRPLPAPVPGILAKALEGLGGRGLTPGAALQQAMTEASQALRRPLRGFTLQTQGSGEIPLPDELVALPGADLALAVGWYQPPGSSWGTRVLLVLVAAPDVEVRAPSPGSAAQARQAAVEGGQVPHAVLELGVRRRIVRHPDTVEPLAPGRQHVAPRVVHQAAIPGGGAGASQRHREGARLRLGTERQVLQADHVLEGVAHVEQPQHLLGMAARGVGEDELALREPGQERAQRRLGRQQVREVHAVHEGQVVLDVHVAPGLEPAERGAVGVPQRATERVHLVWRHAQAVAQVGVDARADAAEHAVAAGIERLVEVDQEHAHARRG